MRIVIERPIEDYNVEERIVPDKGINISGISFKLNHDVTIPDSLSKVDIVMGFIVNNSFISNIIPGSRITIDKESFIKLNNGTLLKVIV